MEHDACVLIVDDDEGSRKSLSLILEKKGCHTETAATGQEALEKLQARPFHVVLLDIKLPDVQGVDLLEPLKAMHPEMTIIMITAYASLEVAVHAMNAGASAFIIKPLNIDDVLTRVGDALEKHRLRKEKRLAEEALRESQERYHTVITNAPVILFMLNREGIFTLSEGKGLEALGIQQGEEVGQSVHELYHDNPQILADNQRVLAGESFSSYVSVRDQVFETHYTPLRNQSGEVVGAIGVSVNITERKQAEKELQQYREHLEELVEARTAELQQANRQLAQEIAERQQAEKALQRAKEIAEKASQAKSEFLANMSHDLRTPLNAILGYAQILQDAENLSERQRNGLHTIRTSGEHLLTLINDILDLSKIEAGRLELRNRDVPLNQFLQELTAIMQVRATQKGIAFVTEFDPNLPAGIRTDEKRLREVLLNLLDNAIKFTDQGRVTLRILNLGFEILDLKEEPQSQIANLKFHIEDTGIGIAPEDLGQVFDAFQQVGPKSAEIRGTGLGLAISQQLVRIMGGEVQGCSEVGKRSTFWFELKFPVVDHVARDSDLPTWKIVGYKGPRRTVLIVDDESANRSLLMNFLFPLGFQLVEAKNGEECLHKVITFHPDAVLLDLRMPVLDGFGATEQIRAIERFQDLPIIAVSASVFKETQQRALKVGFNEFLFKPIRRGELLDLLARYLDVEWAYAEPSKSAMPSPPSTTFSSQELPPEMKRELSALYTAAVRGSHKIILKELDRLEQAGQEFLPLVGELRPLVKRFATEAIVDLLDSIGVDDEA